MAAAPLVWELTIALIVALLLFDFFFHIRKAHVPSLKEAAIWSAAYVGVAVLFGVAVLVFGGPRMGGEYFASYLTEKALSVDNVFVFLVIMASFKVPRQDQQKVLLFGIVLSLLARTGLILIGAALLNYFAWMFYLFGLALLVTAGQLLRQEAEHENAAENIVVRIARRLFHTTAYYDGDKLFTVHEGRRAMTPMILVMVAIGGTDIMFALDSIPAIFGLTQNVFIVFTATAFSLLGLRQLYFLVDDLLDRLVYLSYGLAGVLGFIGIKLILHALHENNLPFINDGEPVPVMEITTGTSLLVIVAVLTTTVAASLFSARGRAETAAAELRRHALGYLDLDYPGHAAEGEAIYSRMVAAERRVRAFDSRLIRKHDKLREQVARAHARHADYLRGPRARGAAR